MAAEQDRDETMSEEEYWAQIRAYNADGTYAFPPPPINADQVFDFWRRVVVPDRVLRLVQERDEYRHAKMEQQMHRLHTQLYRCPTRTLVFRLERHKLFPPLSPELWQERLDMLAQARRYRKHPERLERTEEVQMLRLATDETNALLASVPPRRIPSEQIRTAARLGKLMYNSEGLQQSERGALWDYEVVFMGERQSIRSVYDTWRPDLIVLPVSG